MTDPRHDSDPEQLWVWSPQRRAFVAADVAPPARKFLKGPVPWAWIERASALPGKALAVGLSLWRLAGALRSRTVRLGNREVERLGVDRFAKSRALRALREAGLVEVASHQGRAPRVTIRDA